MAITTVKFHKDKPLDLANNAAYALVTLFGTRQVSFARVLVDSGADYVQLPMFAAQQAGLNLSGATSKQVSGVGGTTTMWLLPGIHIEIEGKSVWVDVLFDPNQGRPLVGRNGLRALGNEYGFDLSKWLWNI